MKKNQGSIIVTILIITIFLSTLLFALIVIADSNLARSTQRLMLLQAQYAAETGADAAIAIINSGNESYTGTTSDIEVVANSTRYKATFALTVANTADPKEKIITATGKLYAPANTGTPRYTRQIEVIAKRTSSTSSTSMLSRNIFHVASSVKDLKIKDMIVNNYIQLDKNTNNLIAENITVADRVTGAGNCSISGAGTLSKPASFTDPGQTKTQIRTAFNNCISPPGNTSNVNFDVFPNQNNIQKVQSTFIPWSQFMDGTYQNSPSGCSDWTTGSSPRNIPTTGNDQKTHYPDSSSGIATTCGTSGVLSLGSNTYTIRNHAHVRGTLCSTSGCTPTFNNPDATTKWVFVEGNINFTGLTTSPGSGPIVFVAYGSDQAAHASNCPLGGAIFSLVPI